MQLLTQRETANLLSLLLPSEGKSLHALQREFEGAFAPADRFRACCAAVLLLEDPTILRLPQRIAAWYLLALCEEGDGATSPFLGVLVQAAANEAASPAERNFLLQLLSGPLTPEAADATPRAHAYSADCSALRSAEAAALLQRAAAGLAARSQPWPAGGTGPPGGRLLGPGASAAAGAAAGAGAGDAAAAAAASGAGAAAAAALGARAHAAAAPTSSGAAAAAAVTAGAAAGGPPAAAAASPGALPPPSARWLSATWERPAPAVLTPLASELKWLNPSLHGQLLWESDMGEPEGPAAAARELLAAALRGPLLPGQQAALLGALGADPRAVLALGLTPRHLPGLVENAPVVATEALLRLMRWPDRAADFLAVLARSDMSLHSLEVVNRLTASGAAPTDFVHLYIANCIHSCEATQDKYVQNRLVRLVCVFLQSLIRNRVINIADLLHEVQAFCINFSRIKEAAKLFRLIKQIEAGLRGADGGVAAPGGGGADEQQGGGEGGE